MAIDGIVPFSGADTLTFSRVWVDSQEGYDKNGNFKTDTRGNELKPQQIEEYTTCESYFKDYMGYETEPYEFYLEKGTHTITFSSNKEAVRIENLSVKSVTKTQSYSEYYESVKDKASSAKDISISVQGENAALDIVKNNKILLVDEIEISLHTKLVEYILSLFNNSECAQLIYTTHNTYLLNENKIRKDQVYFTNKRADGSTDLYSLYDYKDFREGMDIEKAYLQGRFDAIPYIDDAVSAIVK